MEAIPVDILVEGNLFCPSNLQKTLKSHFRGYSRHIRTIHTITGAEGAEIFFPGLSKEHPPVH
jgi:hypothetical protein